MLKLNLKTPQLIIIFSVLIILLFFVLFYYKYNSQQTVKYSFFVAGHPYGTWPINNPGVHPPFKKHFSVINDNKDMAFGVFTGDIVYQSTEKDWDEIDEELKNIDVPVHFSYGNHGWRNPPLVESRYGTTFKSFEESGDLIIILNTNLDKWRITGEQLEFFKSHVEKFDQYSNIFVFIHHVIWWEPDNQFSQFKPNYNGNRADELNFWSEIEPLMRSHNTPVYLFAGDYNSVFYHQNYNYHLIASGMGTIERCPDCNSDNFLIVTVYENNKVDIRIIALTRDSIDALGGIEKYSVPSNFKNQREQLGLPPLK